MSCGESSIIAATSFLGQLGITSGGHMVAAMALMGSPAIIIGIALARWYGKGSGAAFSWSHLLRDAFANGSVLVLCGALVIGLLTGVSRGKALAPFTSDIFRGMLCLFLLDMGIVSARPGGGSGNACVLIAVSNEQAVEVIESIRPVLKRRGGICLVTDAQSVIH